MQPEPPSVQPPEGPARIEDEAELATRARAGDRAAFGRLVERFAPQARRVARAVLQDPHDADDAAQDAFLAALVKLDQYDPRRPFGPWLMQIVGIPEGTVRSEVFHARRRLRELLADWR